MTGKYFDLIVFDCLIRDIDENYPKDKFSKARNKPYLQLLKEF